MHKSPKDSHPVNKIHYICGLHYWMLVDNITSSHVLSNSIQGVLL